MSLTLKKKLALNSASIYYITIATLHKPMNIFFIDIVPYKMLLTPKLWDTRQQFLIS